MASDSYDPFPDLGLLLDAALRAGRDGTIYAERIAGRIALDPDAGPRAAEDALRGALGVPGPRSVSYDMSVTDGYSVLTAALEEFSAGQRDRARGENGNPRRHEWSDLADAMRGKAEDARNAPGDGTGGARC